MKSLLILSGLFLGISYKNSRVLHNPVTCQNKLRLTEVISHFSLTMYLLSRAVTCLLWQRLIWELNCSPQDSSDLLSPITMCLRVTVGRVWYLFKVLLWGNETNARGKRPPPPSKGGGHCLATRHVEGEREQHRKTEISSAPRTARQSAGEEKSLQWIGAAHSHATLNYWSLHCTLQSHQVILVHCRWRPGCSLFCFYSGIAK